MENDIIVFADKTVLRVRGLSIRGLDTRQVEQLLTERFGSFVRVIGVTGDSIDMDVYGVEPEQILRDEEGVIKTLATAQGITALDIAKLVSEEKIVTVHADDIQKPEGAYCARERWIRHD